MSSVQANFSLRDLPNAQTEGLASPSNPLPARDGSSCAMSSAPAIVSSTGPPNAQAEELFCQHCKAKKTGRSLIVCLDGTSNQFGKYNTNVIELYDRIDKDETQPTYYNSGIGTYARPSFASYTYVKQVLDNTVDLAIAWNFERVVLGAYRWLSENYKPGDKIYLFGFSRGAYQVRVLAGMIHEVGLILPGNEEQIPFVYELYADLKGQKFDRSRDDDRRPLNLAQHLKRIFSQNKADWSGDEDEDEGGQPLSMAQRFKRTFSQRGAAVHFLGAWDTVSSIGVVRKKNLPATDEFNHICYFRHALALDERRVKFLPEYVCGGESYEGTVEDSRTCGPHVKEVWFAGCHSDIGGGSKKNTRLNNATVPVLWMGREALIAGLKLYPSKVEWNWDELRKMKPTESLTRVWRVFEMLPFKRLSYTDKQKTTWRPHLWTGRTIKKGQKIHASVAFIRNYVPRATLSGGLPIGRWEDILDQGRQDTTDWATGLEGLLEMDFFDFSDTKAVIELVSHDMRDTVLRRRLTFIASVRDGAAEIRRVDPALALFGEMLQHANDGVKFSGMAMVDDLVRHGIMSVPLLAETLTNETSGIRIRGAEIFKKLVYDTDLLSQCMGSGVTKLLVRMAYPNVTQVQEEADVAREVFTVFNDARKQRGIKMPIDSFDFSDAKVVIELVSHDMHDTGLRNCLEFMASTRDGAAEIGRSDPELTLFRTMLASVEDEIKSAGMVMLADLARHGGATSVLLLAETLKSEISGVRIHGAEAFKELDYDYRADLLSQCMDSGAVKLLVKMANPNLTQAPAELRAARDAFFALDNARRKQGKQMPMDSFELSGTNMVIELIRDDMDDVVLRNRLEFITSVPDGVAEITQRDPELRLCREMLENAKHEVKLTGVAILANLASHDVTESVPLLVQTLKSEASRVGIRSVEALGRLHYSSDLLWRCLDAGAVTLLIEMSHRIRGTQDIKLVIKALCRFTDERRKWGIAIPAEENKVLYELVLEQFWRELEEERFFEERLEWRLEWRFRLFLRLLVEEEFPFLREEFREEFEERFERRDRRRDRRLRRYSFEELRRVEL